MRHDNPDDADGDDPPDDERAEHEHAGHDDGELRDDGHDEGETGEPGNADLEAGTEDVYTALTRLGRQVARRHGIDEDDAEDIGQEAIIKVFRRKGAAPASSGVKGVAGLGTTTARNLALNYIRDEKRRRSNLDDYETERSWERSFEGDPLEQLQVKEAFEIAGRTLNLMTARRRQICLLSMDGLTNVAIATELGIDPSTVNETAALGFEQLRVALIDYLE